MARGIKQPQDWLGVMSGGGTLAGQVEGGRYHCCPASNFFHPCLFFKCDLLIVPGGRVNQRQAAERRATERNSPRLSGAMHDGIHGDAWCRCSLEVCRFLFLGIRDPVTLRNCESRMMCCVSPTLLNTCLLKFLSVSGCFLRRKSI